VSSNLGRLKEGDVPVEDQDTDRTKVILAAGCQASYLPCQSSVSFFKGGGTESREGGDKSTMLVDGSHLTSDRVNIYSSICEPGSGSVLGLATWVYTGV
jgi:hypothetical protein